MPMLVLVLVVMPMLVLVLMTYDSDTFSFLFAFFVSCCVLCIGLEFDSPYYRYTTKDPPNLQILNPKP